jgi:superfamily I DNA/RNA helicase
MEPPELTDQQRALVETPGELFAEACPGGGKTRAIVERFLRRTAEEPRKGIALVSFTNGAVEEVRHRCGQQTQVTQAPHFIGTFDSFINRFIVRLFYAQEYKSTPHFCQSWLGLELAEVRIGGMDQRMPGFKLDWFNLDRHLRATLREESMPRQARWMFGKLTPRQLTQLEALATRRCRTLVKAGIINCTASRALADDYVRRSDTRDLLGVLLANRFGEVIVDEAQDSGPEELHVLELLRAYEVPVVAVADLDQSIYEFRRAEPAFVRNFANTFDGSRRLILDGNHRSSPAICSLNTSLRQGKRQEAAAGENKSCLIPVQLLGFDQPKRVAPAVKDLVAGHDLTPEDVIVLAHKATDAQMFAGGGKDRDHKGEGLVVNIARASAVLRSVSSSSHDRHKAVELIERTLRRITGLNETDPWSDDRWLRGMAVRLAWSVDPTVPDPQQYSRGLREYVKGIPRPSGVDITVSIGTFFQTPNPKSWKASSEETTAIFRSSTIHSVKGQEFPGVVVVLPQELYAEPSGQNVLDYWDNDAASEPRRVLYVGASRAQKLLVMAVHSDHFERVSRILKDDGVPHDRHEFIKAKTGSVWSTPGLF